MKKREISEELVEKTVDVLDEIESSVLDVKTGVTAGRGLGDTSFPSAALDYGCPTPCTSPD